MVHYLVMPSDMQALGRLGKNSGGPSRGRRRRVPVRRGPGPARRRPRMSRGAIVVLGLLLCALAWLVVVTQQQRPPAPAAGTGSEAAETDVANRGARHGIERVSRGGTPSQTATTFARLDGLRLQVPYPEPTVVAFGEASRAEALSLIPFGRLVDSANERFEPVADRAGPDYHVLPSKGRPRGATSAVDVAMPVEQAVRAPVSGRVVQIREYAMEGGVRDWRVVIEPARRPDLHVIVVHLQQPTVAVGEEVAAGQTPLAAVRRLPFERTIDDYLEAGQAHVHLEVRPAKEPDPPDPNKPAALPDSRSVSGR